MTLTSSSASKLSALSGLETAKRVFKGLWSDTTGVHAVLLFGAPGSGKTTLANILAQAWLCKNPAEEGACGECRACQTFENGTAIDFLRVVPEGASNWIRLHSIKASSENGAPLSIQEFLRTLPIMARSKTIVIENADRIYHEAFNSLLKMLEEPPPYGRFVLTTSQLSLVPATIRSRCMCVNTELPHAELSPDASLWDRFCASSPGDAADIAEREGVYRSLVEFAEGLERLPMGAELRAAEELRAIAEAYASAADAPARLSQAKTLEALSRALLMMDAPPEAVHATLEAHRRIIGNANAGITLDSLLIELASFLRRPS